MKAKYLAVLVMAALLLITACRPATSSPAPATSAPTELTVMTHDSFAVSEAVIQAFEAQNNVKVQFLNAGDTGTALNKAILSKDAPLADVFYGVDNTFLSRALQEDLFEPYSSSLLAKIPADFQLDSQDRALPVDYGDVCLNYDIAYFENKNIPPPQNLSDLVKPEYRDLLVVENPATSSPGLAFLFATVSSFGEDGYLTFWQGLKDNNVLVVNDWNSAYNSEFTRYGGTRPIVVSYSSSPPFEMIYAEKPLDKLNTAAITSDGSCFRQIEFVGILKGTTRRALAEKWIDFMLSIPFQEDMPLQMYVFPVNPEAKLNETFQKYLVNPVKPAQLDPEAIAANRDTWIAAWTELVLR